MSESPDCSLLFPSLPDSSIIRALGARFSSPLLLLLLPWQACLLLPQNRWKDTGKWGVGRGVSEREGREPPSSPLSIAMPTACPLSHSPMSFNSPLPPHSPPPSRLSLFPSLRPPPPLDGTDSFRAPIFAFIPPSGAFRSRDLYPSAGFTEIEVLVLLLIANESIIVLVPL